MKLRLWYYVLINNTTVNNNMWNVNFMTNYINYSHYNDRLVKVKKSYNIEINLIQNLTDSGLIKCLFYHKRHPCNITIMVTSIFFEPGSSELGIARTFL